MEQYVDVMVLPGYCPALLSHSGDGRPSSGITARLPIGQVPLAPPKRGLTKNTVSLKIVVERARGG
jgi:hypothetical protein